MRARDDIHLHPASRWWLACILVLAADTARAGGAAPAVDPPAGRLSFRTYDAEMGLQNLVIEFLEQDGTGFLWAGTEDGLYRYDGSTFRRFGQEEGLPSSIITALHVAAKDEIWIGTYAGLSRWDGARMKVFGPEAGLPLVPIGGLARCDDGTVWAGSASGLFRLEGERFERLPQWDAGAVTALWIDPPCGLTVAAGPRLLQRAGGGFAELAELGEEDIVSIARDHAGRLFAQSARHLWMQAFGRAFTDLAPALPLLTEDSGLSLDRAGRLWAATVHGAFRLDEPERLGEPGALWQLGPEDGLPTGAVRTVHEDREGSLWIGGTGLHRLLGRGLLRSYREAEGLPSSSVWCMHRDHAGRLWVGTSAGAAVASADGWSAFEPAREYAIRAITRAPDDRLLMGGAPMAVLRVEPRSGEVESFGVEAGLSGKRLLALHVADDTVWAATVDAGLFSAPWADVLAFTRVELPGGSDSERIADVISDRQRRIWVAGELGLAVREAGVWRRLTAHDGLYDTAVSYLLERRDGSMCVAYLEPVGISCFEAPAAGEPLRIEHFGAERGLTKGRAYFLGEDTSGRLWVGTGVGVDVFDGERVEHFGTRDGMPGDDCTARAFFAEPGGAVWLGTTTGLAHFAGKLYEGLPEPPHPAIVDVLLGGSSAMPVADMLRAPHAANTLEVRYAGLSFLNEARVAHQVRLVGLEDWRLTDGRVARYPRLAPGEYRFELRARLGRGAWSETAGFSLTVLPAWWQAWWFTGACVLALACLVLLLVRWRLAALERRNVELERQVAVRTEELAQANRSLTEMSLTDPLTGLRNRRFVSLSLPDEVAQVQRSCRDALSKSNRRATGSLELVFLMVDLDHFKTVNDQYGHAAGDAVLRDMRAILTQVCRQSDTAVRWGGEEFLIVARQTRREDAPVLAERLRRAVSEHAFRVGGDRVLRRTCSIGFAAFPLLREQPDLIDWEEVVDLADRCLYAAKTSGRDAWVGVVSVKPEGGVDGEALRSRLGELIERGVVRVESLSDEGRLALLGAEAVAAT